MDSRIVFSGTQDRLERRKVFVEVTLKQDVDGHKIPLSIKWKNGTVYNVISYQMLDISVRCLQRLKQDTLF